MYLKILALAGLTQWIECWPVNQRVSGLIANQGFILNFIWESSFLMCISMFKANQFFLIPTIYCFLFLFKGNFSERPNPYHFRRATAIS